MNTKQRASYLNIAILVYVAAVSVIILRTVVVMTDKPADPNTSPIPVLDTASIISVDKQLGGRDPRASDSAGAAVQFGKAEPFRK